MYVVVEIEGLNLERLLRIAAQEGLILRAVRRTGGRKLCVRVAAADVSALKALCALSFFFSYFSVFVKL